MPSPNSRSAHTHFLERGGPAPLSSADSFDSLEILFK